MELAGHQIALAHRRVDGGPIRRRGRDHVLLGLQIVGVDKVHIGLLGQPGKQGFPLFQRQGVPPDVGDFQAALLGQADNAALQQAQALGARGLLAGFKEDLQPQANAQKGPAGVHKIVDGLLQAPGPELVHGVAKGAHPWQHRGVGGQQGGGVGGDLAVAADVAQGLFHALEIARAVVDDGNQGNHLAEK